MKRTNRFAVATLPLPARLRFLNPPQGADDREFVEPLSLILPLCLAPRRQQPHTRSPRYLLVLSGSPLKAAGQPQRYSGGVANRRIEDEIARIGAVRDAATVRKGLLDRVGLVVAKAAKVAAEMQMREVLPELAAAFERLLEKPAERDPQCWGKNAIAKALMELDYRQSAVFLAGRAARSNGARLGRPGGHRVDSARRLHAGPDYLLGRAPRGDPAGARGRAYRSGSDRPRGGRESRRRDGRRREPPAASAEGTGGR